MSDSLPAALVQLERRLREWHAPIADHLRPGISRSEAELVLGEIGVIPTEEMVELWAWHDGTDFGVAEHGYFDECPETLLLGGWYLLGVRDVVWSYRWQQSLFMSELLPPSWVPVVDFIDAPVMCAETDRSSPNYGALFIVDAHVGLPADPPQPFTGSLLEFVNTLLAFFGAGAVVADSPTNGGLDLDRSRLPKHIPPSAYW